MFVYGATLQSLCVFTGNPMGQGVTRIPQDKQDLVPKQTTQNTKTSVCPVEARSIASGAFKRLCLAAATLCLIRSSFPLCLASFEAHFKAPLVHSLAQMMTFLAFSNVPLMHHTHVRLCIITIHIEDSLVLLTTPCALA